MLAYWSIPVEGSKALLRATDDSKVSSLTSDALVSLDSFSYLPEYDL